jgi:hypothetical protein
MRFFALPLLLAPLSLAHADTWSPSDEEAAVYRALSAKDAPGCADVEALAADPVPALKAVVEHATMPPWAPMRAAHCLTTRHAEQARAELLHWVSHDDTRGFALLVLDSLDAVAEAIALEIARAALAGPLEADARERLTRCERPELKALAEPAVD